MAEIDRLSNSIPINTSEHDEAVYTFQNSRFAALIDKWGREATPGSFIGRRLITQPQPCLASVLILADWLEERGLMNRATLLVGTIPAWLSFLDFGSVDFSGAFAWLKLRHWRANLQYIEGPTFGGLTATGNWRYGSPPYPNHPSYPASNFAQFGLRSYVEVMNERGEFERVPTIDVPPGAAVRVDGRLVRHDD